ncbi:MAG: 2-C-methyl-D-erythritol 2,4-cyclodiphosphate synthase [SAR86 cluster bacterium]|uniref:2-C-methyl-D-erythritol 2,4-cyclodiphosphate synthase n=1 Tax=SAR86 cluster bacterium TaxID=2030880 RepID=A0A2A4MMZ4_9GAMM|nr:MAG: 2-C-methyl-D-erythritol 2,4-cyclodiphosphate synthase [SAR86 cluster bacterium]
MLRIGHGYDVHRFAPSNAPERDLMLGGVCIPSALSLLAHSDGDVLIHALCDGILGAIGAGDIGQHFPDTDPRFKNISSSALLTQVLNLANDDGWQLVNVDVTVIAQVPTLSPYRQSMRENLATLLGTDTARVNIKATTTEKLGFVGRKEGIACHAVVLLAGADAR